MNATHGQRDAGLTSLCYCPIFGVGSRDYNFDDDMILGWQGREIHVSNFDLWSWKDECFFHLAIRLDVYVLNA